ncbi:ricin-type beta-trefoil lectin protein [Lentzea atacamensis]|uniref:Ricin-type beta-trefoil lectin protein n=1 Tax=Lentzea atacamensis TaxID=531938 RepID=A0ABX9E7D9_9PSEU|nr:trypsin-like serine protease [Lentzea atacamensis]RAS65593.1 ricin-type beta-trefoil lectin protein [Lentzea atacamensis]
MRPGKRISAIALTFVAAATFVIPASAVVGGAPVSEGTHTFIAKIDVGNRERTCTGALVDPFWVVTAKSCVAGTSSKIVATVGRTNVAQTSGVTRDVKAVVPREDRDLALLKLQYPIMEIAPVKVGTAAAGETVQVPGFGHTSTGWTTEQLYQAAFAVDSSATTSFAITGASKGLCRGDAGAPLLNARNEIVGVGSTSWQGGCFGVSETRTGATGSRYDNIGDWVKTHVSRTVMLQNNFNKRCMLHWSGNIADGSPVTQFDCEPRYYDQAWTMKPVSGGFQLRNGVSDRCVSARTSNDTFGTEVWAKDCADTDTLQKWQVNKVTGGTQLRNVQTGLCLAVWHGTPNNGAPVTEQVCEPAYIDQVWTELPV